MMLHDPVSGKKKAARDDDDANGGAANRKAGGTSEAASSSLDASGGGSLSTTRGKASASPSGTSVSLRVNNNKISTLDDMHEALGAVFDDPSKLQWLDLSGNALTSIASTAFAPYPDIYTLHLHGNKLQRYADIDSLAACLPRLHALTLHGNPVEEKKHYRNYVIASFPKLQQLDFSSVTRGDREKAETWATIYKRALTSPKHSGRGGASSTDIDQDT